MKRPWLWAALLAGWAGAANADVPPPPGYVEQCTMDKQKKEGEDCQMSRPWYRERDKGQREWGTKGYTRRCRTSGASVWLEIWCKAAEPAKPAEPAKVAAEPTTQPSAPPATTVLDAGGPPPIALPDAGGTAPQPVPAAPKASEPGAARSKSEDAPRKSRACSTGGGDAAGAWLVGLALMGALARGRRRRSAD